MKQTRPEIQHVLSRLRRWIRRYVLIEGLAATITLACLLFWLTYGIDLAYFHLSQLELPGWFRLLCTIVMAGLLLAIAATWIAARLLTRMRPADLALALERKFPELNDRLITAVELADRSQAGAQTRMLDRTIDEAVERLSTLQLKETINPVPLRRMLLAALVLSASVLIFGIADAQAMERWYRAYILGRNDYWEPFRRNELKIHVVAQPGDRVRNFDENGIYRHPRGQDLQLVALVPPPALPPDRVLLQFISFGGTGQKRGQMTMSRNGEAEFRQSLSRVVDDHQLWFRGGDYVNRQPFRVQVVDPPHVNALELRCDYPTYTGLDGLEDQVVKVVGRQVALPMETQFELAANMNKPLLQARLQCRDFELKFGFKPVQAGPTPIPTTLTIFGSEGSPSRTLTLDESPAAFFDRDRNHFHVPLIVTAAASHRLEALLPPTSETPASATDTARNDAGPNRFPLPIAPDDTLQIVLEDEDLIESPEPATLTINGIVDQPPVVDSRRSGIGTMITRMATIPIEGKLTDDYGVEAAWFGYRIERAQPDPAATPATEQRHPLAHAPTGQKEFRLQQSPDVAVEYFNLIPLKLEEGQKLVLSVSAEDGDHLNGPHIAHGELMTFQIVSADELLGKLADREMTLRARFEQIRTEVGELKASLEETRKQIAEIEGGKTKPPVDKAVVAAYVDRALHQIRKNHTESRSIELSFRDLREEMVNNRVDTAELLERIERRVIEPLSLLNSADFMDVDRRLGTLRLTVERGQGMRAAGDDVVPAIDGLLARMDAILAEMRDRGTLNDVIQNLQKMIELQEKLLEETENKRIEDNFFTPLNGN